ncbi:GAF and ANTAR domain-containing protein [Actinoplanes sp. NBRC 103695]|uniref:GAF and ANTAR domain-containing protein n=1 Tax=Actinoplanes sp. NBRC 103695 TaxID=3032202 RepID=UPI0024A23129|nr:GAF and ANTAR domain-containing protein [Actinoplanes sp. NBRC 103695]GLZ00695.1 GAF domain-containing protein [Actinoplanes sp. NBRC 103695]
MDDHRTVVRGLIDRQPGHLDLLQRVCCAAAEALSASGAGISVMTADGTRGVSATSDPVSERVEELQFTLGEGPCIDAFASRRPVLTADLAETEAYQWPVYAPAAREDGVRAVFAFPLQVGAARLGVMDIFRARVGALTDEELRTAFGFVEVTVDALLDMQEDRDAHDDDRAAVLDVGRRAELFQAQGMVMVQLGVTIGEALVRMRAYAYAENRRLEDIARDVVNRQLRLDGIKE